MEKRIVFILLNMINADRYMSDFHSVIQIEADNRFFL